MMIEHEIRSIGDKVIGARARIDIWAGECAAANRVAQKRILKFIPELKCQFCGGLHARNGADSLHAPQIRPSRSILPC